MNGEGRRGQFDYIMTVAALFLHYVINFLQILSKHPLENLVGFLEESTAQGWDNIYVCISQGLHTLTKTPILPVAV